MKLIGWKKSVTTEQRRRIVVEVITRSPVNGYDGATVTHEDLTQEDWEKVMAEVSSENTSLSEEVSAWKKSWDKVRQELRDANNTSQHLAASILKIHQEIDPVTVDNLWEGSGRVDRIVSLIRKMRKFQFPTIAREDLDSITDKVYSTEFDTPTLPSKSIKNVVVNIVAIVLDRAHPQGLESK